jgi:hypothetical protein
MLPINLLAVVVAAVACFVIGFLMHGPIAGKLWMKLANIHPTGKEKLSDMYPQMLKNFIMNLLTAYCLANIIFVSAIYHNTVGSATSGMAVAFWVWLGFVVTSTSMDVIWMGKSKNLWLFECVSSLICFLAMGAIIAGM